jgi:small subunit ribosomal protein S7
MRKSTAKKRILLPDPIYNDILVTRFLNSLMYDGKKNTASTIFHECLDIVAKRTNEDGLEVFKKGLANVTPQVEVRSRRVGGATFQIPSEVRPERVAGEIVSASKEEGAAFKKKEDIHKMAEANKAFSHFRF